MWNRVNASRRLLVFSTDDGAGISTLAAGISERREDVIARESKRRSNR
jgi:hypothetical protein